MKLNTAESSMQKAVRFDLVKNLRNGLRQFQLSITSLSNLTDARSLEYFGVRGDA